MRYVVGFVFDEKLEKVMLIKKLRPEAHLGLFNGVGGKIEENETALAAMQRECEEESSLVIRDWRPMGEIVNSKESADDVEFQVFVFGAISDITAAKTMTDEEIHIIDVKDIEPGTCVQNIPDIISFMVTRMSQ